MIIIMHIYNWYHSITTGIHLYTRTQITMYMVHSPCFIVFPCLFPLLPLLPFPIPFHLLGTLLCCDRIRPPQSQVACKLTSSSSTLFPTLPPPNSQDPGYQRLTKTTLRIRHLLSGTLPTSVPVHSVLAPTTFCTYFTRASTVQVDELSVSG